jgi:hypothetical protein
MPRAKARFKGGSPKDGNWPGNPEQAMRDIATRHKAEYIEGSLVFVPGGHFAEALFRTVEPESESRATRLHRLARDLDAVDMTLFVDAESWQLQQDEEEAG